MSKKNPADSVRQRLLNLSRKTGEDFQLLFTRYAIERLLFRLGRSEYAQNFVLKGAMLFAFWTGEMHRPTRDLDLLGYGDPTVERLAGVFVALSDMDDPDDGLQFDSSSVTVDAIREDQEYGGQRIKLTVRLGQARVSLQIDVGFGDAVTPAAETIEYPTLLGMEPPRLRAYPKETVVAEKLEAMVQLGLTNTRMKDFYDLVVLARSFAFDGPTLRDAIAATFRRRGTPFPSDTPIALTDAFAADETKRKQWLAFLSRSGLGERAGELIAVAEELRTFLLAPLRMAANGAVPAVNRWEPGGPWA